MRSPSYAMYIWLSDHVCELGCNECAPQWQVWSAGRCDSSSMRMSRTTSLYRRVSINDLSDSATGATSINSWLSASFSASEATDISCLLTRLRSDRLNDDPRHAARERSCWVLELKFITAIRMSLKMLASLSARLPCDVLTSWEVTERAKDARPLSDYLIFSGTCVV